MKAQIVEQVELFSEAELESLEFVPEELEDIEAERVPDLDSISFEEVAKEMEAYFEGGVEGVRLEMNRPLPPELQWRTLRWREAMMFRDRFMRPLQRDIQNWQRDIQRLDNERQRVLQNNPGRANQLRQSIDMITRQVTQAEDHLRSLTQVLNQIMRPL